MLTSFMSWSGLNIVTHGVSQPEEGFQETGSSWGDHASKNRCDNLLGNDSMSFHSMYPTEIEDMIINYYFDQALLFTFVDVEIIKEWLWDMYCREPEKIVVDSIKY